MNKMKVFFWALAFMGIVSCGGPAEKGAEQGQHNDVSAFEQESFQAFYQNLQSLCGKSFEGKQVYMQEGRESWEEKGMIMHVTVCEDDELHIPFHLDEDHSRTWMFFNEDGKLRFRHDHRYKDGTPEEMTMYGGYADAERGTPFYQVFPADKYTIDIHPISVDSEWVVELSEDLSVFSYQLHHEGEMIFEARFDLSNPV